METLFNVHRPNIYLDCVCLQGSMLMKLALSNRNLTVILVVVLVFSGVNTYLLLDRTSKLQTQLDQSYTALDEALNQTYTALNQTDYNIQNQLNVEIDNLNARLPIEQYDYVIYRDEGWVLAKNGRTGLVDFNSTDAAYVFNQAVNLGNSVYVKSDEYSLNWDVLVGNKKNAHLDSDGATLLLNGHRIIVRGDDYQFSQNNQVSGLRIVNGALRVENSFRTTVTNMIFENCTVGLELANTNKWSEGTKIDTVHFNKCTQSLVFRTNLTGATGSYGNTEVNRCYFNLPDNATAITVETNVELTDSQMQNIRIWIGEFGEYNQTGLKVDGSMYQTLMDGVVFESFATGPLENALLYAVKIGPTAQQTPILQAGVSILGSWTARIHNPFSIWIYGAGGVFKQENVAVPVGSFDYGQAIVVQMRPATITSFKPQIAVQGSFRGNETVTVRVRLEFVDNVFSSSVEKQFSGSGSVWLDDGDLLALFPSQNVVYAILVDAKVNKATTDAAVQVSMYGTTT